MLLLNDEAHALQLYTLCVHVRQQTRSKRGRMIQENKPVGQGQGGD